MTLLKILSVATIFLLLSNRGFADENFVRPDDTQLQEKLTPMQFKVVRENGTEPAFSGAYWDHHAAGIYVDVVSGEALFSSLDKFDSGTGWPSFTRPLVAENVFEKKDRSLFMERTEVRSRLADSHLGHVFSDGPPPTGLRYCINSAALNFIPAAELADRGYPQFVNFFAHDQSGSGAAASTERPKTALATFAGGCFWCMEKPFDKTDGVLKTTVGYTGGESKDPTYKEVSAGWTGHAESIEIEFDPARVSYEKLLEVFWRNVDPTVKDRQFCDWGNQYRSAIFYHDAAQHAAAEKSKEKLKSRFPDQELFTEITPAGKFYPAEEYHQDYYKKNPIRYTFFRSRCGRDQRLEELWGEKTVK